MRDELSKLSALDLLERALATLGGQEQEDEPGEPEDEEGEHSESDERRDAAEPSWDPRRAGVGSAVPGVEPSVGGLTLEWSSLDGETEGTV